MSYNIDTYMLEYDLFIAESEMFEELTSMRKIIVESGDNIEGLYYLTEGIKDTILKYIGKIVDGVQKAWNILKTKFVNNDLPDNIYLKAIEKKIQEATHEPKFEIKNHKIYDDNKFKMITVVPFEYEKIKQSLNSVENFIKTNYSSVASGYSPEGNFNVKDMVYHYVITNKGDARLTSQQIKEYYNWCVKDYRNMMSSVEADLKLINNMTANVENYVKSTIASESVDMLMALTEAPTNQPGTTPQIKPPAPPKPNQNKPDNTPENDKMKIEDDPDKKEQETDANSQFLKDLQTYMSGTTQVLTAKLEILRNRKNDYIKILKHYIPVVKKNGEKDNGENKEAAAATAKGTKKVKI